MVKISALLLFLLVGGAATATHTLVFGYASSRVQPEIANAMGFILAFFVSFSGHRWLSFRATKINIRQSIARFAATAMAGFLTNEAVFSILFRLAGSSAWVAFFAGLVFASVQTYFLSRYWAFRL